MEQRSSVKQIGAYAFQRCSNLRSVSLEKSLEYIQDNAFQECDNLTIVFNGTKKEWEQIGYSFGNYRVVYAVINGVIVVINTLIAGPRGDIYKKMGNLD